jgi:type III secretory pathway component EscV
MIDLPGETAAKIKEALVTAAGKSFLALTPANCQEALSAIRDIAGSSQDQLNNVLLTKDARLRIHLRKLTDLEFPNLLVASQEELIEKNNA